MLTEASRGASVPGLLVRVFDDGINHANVRVDYAKRRAV